MTKRSVNDLRTDLAETLNRVAYKGERVVVEWNTALAGPNPLRAYDIFAGDKLLLSLPFRPQLTEAPLRATLNGSDVGDAPVRVVAS